MTAFVFLFSVTSKLVLVLTCAAGKWSESSYGSSGIHCLCSRHHRIYSRKSKNNRYWNTWTLVLIMKYYGTTINYPHYKLHTHSKERIQQPRAMPSRMLRVRRWPPDTTWVVLSQTRSAIEKPPSDFTSWTTVCWCLQEEDRMIQCKQLCVQQCDHQCSEGSWGNLIQYFTYSVGMLVMTSVLIAWNSKHTEFITGPKQKLV